MNAGQTLAPVNRSLLHWLVSPVPLLQKLAQPIILSAACVIRSLTATVRVFASKLSRASSSETIEELRSTVSPLALPSAVAEVDAPGALPGDCPVRAIRAAAA